MTANSPAELGAALLALPDDEFTYSWFQLGDPVRMQLSQSQRQRCIDRYRSLTPWHKQSIARLSRLAPAGAGVAVPHYRVLTAVDVMNAPPLQWLVRGVLSAHGLACIYGASGSAKSFLAIDLGEKRTGPRDGTPTAHP